MSNTHVLLIVEDDDDLRESLAELIALRGFKTVAVANGREALDKLVGGLTPCLIILDLMLPDVSGWEFRERQLAIPELSRIPVLIMSGANDLASHAKQLQAIAFLPKPISFDLLFRMLATYC
jgi:two-component system response regulator MprA